MSITLPDLKKLKTIHDMLDYAAELYGKAYYNAGKYMSLVYDICEDGFEIEISLPREGSDRAFIKYVDILDELWYDNLRNMIEERNQAYANQQKQKAQQQLDKELQQKRELYVKLKAEFEPDFNQQEYDDSILTAMGR
jgi:hypothetical protein